MEGTLLPEKMNFSAEEDKILARWARLNAFQRSLELSKGKPEVRAPTTHFFPPEDFFDTCAGVATPAL
jgi:hypothetical protein